MAEPTSAPSTGTVTYDVVVIGAGAVGENAADRAGRRGLTVAVVEHELVGGECSYWACMPSKALLRPGTVLAAARAVPGAADVVSGPLDPAAVLARRDEFAAHWDDHGQVGWLDSVGIALLRGEARIVGERELVVEGEDGPTRVIARHAVIVATGSEPVVPPIDGLALARPWTSREATSVKEVPGHLVILGGGVVGVEMAVAYRDLGAQVTLLVRGDPSPPRRSPPGCATSVWTCGSARRPPPCAATSRGCTWMSPGRRVRRRCTPTRCWSPPVAARAPRRSAWTSSVWSPVHRSPWTTRSR
jgi:dihydrolipoamide dehydrogenase